MGKSGAGYPNYKGILNLAIPVCVVMRSDVVEILGLTIEDSWRKRLLKNVELDPRVFDCSSQQSFCFKSQFENSHLE